MDKTTEMMIFVHAVEAGGFSAAARALDVTPSAVSKQIQRLEDRLRIRLFQRTTRRTQLPEAGQAYYQHCTRIRWDIKEAEEIVTSLMADPQDTLRVAATVSFERVEILPHINEFMTRYPRINVEFELTERHIDLIEEGIDVAIQWREQMSDPNVVARSSV